MFKNHIHRRDTEFLIIDNENSVVAKLFKGTHEVVFINILNLINMDQSHGTAVLLLTIVEIVFLFRLSTYYLII